MTPAPNEKHDFIGKDYFKCNKCGVTVDANLIWRNPTLDYGKCSGEPERTRVAREIFEKLEKIGHKNYVYDDDKSYYLMIASDIYEKLKKECGVE